MRTQIRIIVDFLFKITQPRRKWNGIIKVFKKKKEFNKYNRQPRTIKSKGKVNTDSENPKQKLRVFLTRRYTLYEMSKGTFQKNNLIVIGNLGPQNEITSIGDGINGSNMKLIFLIFNFSRRLLVVYSKNSNNAFYIYDIRKYKIYDNNGTKY